MGSSTKIRNIVGGMTVLAASIAAFSPSTAADLLIRRRLPSDAAARAVGAAMRACEANGFAVSAAVVDIDGGLQVVIRGDHAGIQTVQSAVDKATTSAVYGIDSSVWVDRAAKGEEISPLLNQLPHLILARGGVVIRIGDEVLGGIAVGGAPGGQIDEKCARVGADILQKEFGSALPSQSPGKK